MFEEYFLLRNHGKHNYRINEHLMFVITVWELFMELIELLWSLKHHNCDSPVTEFCSRWEKRILDLLGYSLLLCRSCYTIAFEDHWKPAQLRTTLRLSPVGFHFCNLEQSLLGSNAFFYIYVVKKNFNYNFFVCFSLFLGGGRAIVVSFFSGWDMAKKFQFFFF